MKYTISSVVFLLGICFLFLQPARAQTDDIYTSVGLNVALPAQNFNQVASTGIGVSARFDQKIYKSFSGTVGVGYYYFSASKRFDGSASLDPNPYINLIPVKLGVKYSINKALYVLLEGGVSRVWTSNAGVDEVKRFYLTYCPGFGVYFPTNYGRFDLGAGVDVVKGDYFSPFLRLAYCFE